MGPSTPSPARRFLVLGLDGGTFDLLDPLMESGDLPFLRAMAQGGVKAPLTSVYPAKTIPAWYSFATGLDPGELGIFGFTEPNGGPGHSRLVQSFRPAEAVWDRLSRTGRRVGVVNFPLWSAYPVHGFILPGMFSGSAPTFPANLRAEVEGVIGGEYPSELPVFKDASRDAWVAAATRSVVQRGRAAAALASRHRPDFLFALFRETDRLQHQLWTELDRPAAEIPEDLRTFWRAVDTACAGIDRAFRATGGRAVTLVISDHGHGRIHSDFLTNRWLQEEGFLRFRSAPAPVSRRLFNSLLLPAQRIPGMTRISRRVADILREGLGASLANLVVGDASFEQATAHIDWRKTVAFSYPVPEGIYLNPFNPDLASPARRAAVLQEIRARLEKYTSARIEVLGPEQIYRGRNLRHAPDLLIRVDDMRTEPRMDFAYPRSLIRNRPDYFCGSGTHRMDGILIGAGDGIRAGANPGAVRLIDVAPTILEGMGEVGPAAWIGRSFGARLGLAS
ncbi:MAG TPA: alkaline phosphatase family protein [Thermoplasmata archaeon]|nr:alkaline phosphatase family protein [Thermoplasmata archaeon]